MTAKICFLHILFPQGTDFIFLCYDFFSIWIIRFFLFFMAVAGITHRKMRSHLFYNKNRHLVYNIIFIRHHICGRICTNCKFPNRKAFMEIQKIFPDEFLIFFFSFKIIAGKFISLSFFKPDF